MTFYYRAVGVSTAGSTAGTGRARQRRSALTEQRIVSAAGELFVGDGYAATTMAAIAARAGVAVQSLYLRFGGKLQILGAALDAAIVGDTVPVPLLERDWFARLRELADGPSAVRLFLAEMETLMSRTYALYEVVLRAGDEARGLLAANKAQRREGLQAVAGVLAEKRGFAPHLDAARAADVLYGLVSEEHYGLLVAERGWTPSAWRDWVSGVVIAAFYPAGGD
jgi:AcrR family transcriptional regulator